MNERPRERTGDHQETRGAANASNGRGKVARTLERSRAWLAASAVVGAVGAAAVPACSSSSSGPGQSPDGGGATADPFAGVPANKPVEVKNLVGQVEVIRDKHGMVHIYATNVADVARVEGYQMARDRTAQLEVLRRFSEGRVAELLGLPGLALDIAARTLGMHRTAKTIYESLAADDEVKVWIDAFADGVSQFNARVLSGDEALPSGMIGLPENAFEPWTGVDVLSVGRFQVKGLAYSADDEIAETEFVEKARAEFAPGAATSDARKRTGFLHDLLQFAPIDGTTAMDGFPNDAPHTLAPAPRPVVRAPAGSTPTTASPVTKAPAAPSFRVPASLLASTRAWREGQRQLQSLMGERSNVGSNNWIVGPKRTATGHVMLANDPHLALGSPSVFWMVHLRVTSPGDDHSKDLDTAGLAFPGLPGVILGFNRNIAWGATTANYDVTDVYRETLTTDGKAVTFKGQPVPLQTIHETIKVASLPSVEYDVLQVPHHGPVIPRVDGTTILPPDPAEGALSIRWTGSEVSSEFRTTLGMMRASNVEDTRVALRTFGVGAQNWIVGDTKGDVFYSSQAKIPRRDAGAVAWDASKFEGTIPCFVLPGDGTAEWTGVIDEAYVPHQKNPPKGYLATANNDQVGTTLDGDPTNDKLPDGSNGYLACWNDAGLRVGRIAQRIENAGHPITLDDMASIQSDARSGLAAHLVPMLMTALAHAEEERASPGTHPDLAAAVVAPRYAAANVADVQATLDRWSKESDYDAAAGVSLDDGTPVADDKEAVASKATLVFNMWLVRMLGTLLDDELNFLGFFRPDNLNLRRAITSLLEADRTKLATYDAASGDSSIFDDMTTPDVVESREERMVTALLDSLDVLSTRVGQDRAAWRWGKLHVVQMLSLVPLWPSFTVPTTDDPKFPLGFPRHGDGFSVDVGSYEARPDRYQDVTFDYHQGPVQRFVVDIDPAGPVARNVLPGGAIWDTKSPHFHDELDAWRRNQNHPVPFSDADVLQAAESRTVYGP